METEDQTEAAVVSEPAPATWRTRVGRLLDMAAWALVAVVVWRFLGPQASADLAGVRGVGGVLELPPDRPAVIEVSSHT
ncbi:MAG: hypothetical protein VKO64_07270 [Candidatus Sericytochromatia bacterium]|nr:hypothetical protein [Candidatus Sericytochromatia bacterium]